MEIRFDLATGARRALVAEIAKVLDTASEYLGAPTFAYQIGDFTLTRDGALTCADADAEVLKNVLTACEEAGFFPTHPEQNEVLSICVSRERFTPETFQNLDRLLQNKGRLIRHAFNCTELPYITGDETVDFPWFTPTADADAVNAYMQFIDALVDLANTARTRERIDNSENEKYAFRCFLLRLGFIGDNFKKTRKILMQNLEGCSAFRQGVRSPKPTEGNPIAPN